MELNGGAGEFSKIKVMSRAGAVGGGAGRSYEG